MDVKRFDNCNGVVSVLFYYTRQEFVICQKIVL
jgi:hypothetical protein